MIYRSASALEAVPKLAGVHRGSALRLRLVAPRQVSQAVRWVVALSLVDVRVRYHH